MELLISHRSALEYWRLYGMTQVEPERRQRRRTAPVEAFSASELKRMDTRGLTFPLEVMVGTTTAKRKSQMVKAHIASAPLPEGSIVDVGEGLLVVSAELCFFQLVKRLPFSKVLRLGLEFCGKYSLPANDAAKEDPDIKEDGFKKRPALTSVERLSSFLDRSEGVLNQRQLQGLLRYIGNGSASPMESKLLILLTLPYRHGGFGLPLPELDAPVEPGKIARNNSGKKVYNNLTKDNKNYRCDFYWRDLKLAVEYDSDKHHLRSKQKAEDSKKKNYLLSKGVHVITVSKLQAQSDLEVERVALQLAARHDRQLKHRMNPKWAEKHRLLRRQLEL
ncbi:MAG: endonuclease domain-containing protein [Coriobacteriia bacterium]|nr:endonuclease domain-containing protein [Coriobacteriia bacterium]